MSDPNITTCLWFDGHAEEAARFYTSIFENSRINEKSYYPKEGKEIHGHDAGDILTVSITLNGTPFTILNGGPNFKFNESVSFQVFCDTQQEIDYYWEKLTADGGEESQCGWLKDKYGVSWQVVPRIMEQLLLDPEKAERVFRTFMPMKKLDLEKIVNA